MTTYIRSCLLLNDSSATPQGVSRDLQTFSELVTVFANVAPATSVDGKHSVEYSILSGFGHRKSKGASLGASCSAKWGSQGAYKGAFRPLM